MEEKTKKTLKLAGLLLILVFIPIISFWAMLLGRSSMFIIMSPQPIIFLLIVALIYFGLWLIPLKYPSTKPFFISVTIGAIISAVFVPIAMLIYGLVFVKPVYHPDALIWIGLVYIIPPGLILIMAVSIIIGIIKSVNKGKRVKR
ncbi:hypothetical protein KY331_03690 [Candidatus Woesearchaeota archaeon]|nr:hypothetical protein [Candidatus Woesearchaeota archaeon]